jgi:predicted transglutaminase-like cysteine proteinase
VPLRVRIQETSSLSDHAQLIAEQVDASLLDPETRKLAVALASGTHGWVNLPGPQGRPVATPAVPFHNRVYRVASRQCQARDDVCAISNVWNFLVLNVRYTGDIDQYDTYQDLRTTLEAGGGDCDDFTIAFGALLRALGFEVVQKIISLDGKYWAHVYPVVQAGDRWIALDATEDKKKFGWEYPHAKTAVAFPLTLMGGG